VIPGCPYIQAAMNKYGKEWFQVEQIDAGNTPEQALELEKWWIKRLGTRSPMGYNLTDGGRGKVGYHHTDATRAILSAKHTGKIMSDEARRKMSEAAKQRIVSDATRQKHSEISKRLGLKPPPNSFRGHHHTAESNEKNRQAHLGRPGWNKGLKGVSVAWNKGKTMIETLGAERAAAAKQKMREAKLGKKRLTPRAAPSDKTRQQISDSLRKYFQQKKVN
jgi:group I intron endonuclease